MTPSRSLLAQPIAVLGIAVLLFNDHVAKAAWGGWLVGKLSDFAGFLFFPAAVLAALELARGRTCRSRRLLLGTTLCCLGVFAAINLWPTPALLYTWALGLLQWPFVALPAALAGGTVPAPAPVAHTIDPTDIVAAMLGAALGLFGMAQASRDSQASRTSFHFLRAMSRWACSSTQARGW